jgi:hypothetical protein
VIVMKSSYLSWPSWSSIYFIFICLLGLSYFSRKTHIGESPFPLPQTGHTLEAKSSIFRCTRASLGSRRGASWTLGGRSLKRTTAIGRCLKCMVQQCCQQCSWHKQRNINIWIKRVCGYIFENVWKNRLCQTKSDSAPTGRWIKLTCTLSSMSCFVGTLETSRYISHLGNPAQDSSARTRSRFWLWHAPTMLKSHGQQK